MSLKPDDNDITPKSNSVKSSMKDQTISYIVYIYNFIGTCTICKDRIRIFRKSHKSYVFEATYPFENQMKALIGMSPSKYRHKIKVAIYVMENL